MDPLISLPLVISHVTEFKKVYSSHRPSLCFYYTRAEPRIFFLLQTRFFKVSLGAL